MSDRGILSSLRYLLADFIGEDDDTPPFLPEGLPEAVVPVASEATGGGVAAPIAKAVIQAALSGG